MNPRSVDHRPVDHRHHYYHPMSSLLFAFTFLFLIHTPRILASPHLRRKGAGESVSFVVGLNTWRYVYDPLWLRFPAEAHVKNAHGLYISDDGNAVVLTYEDADNDSHCLLQWTKEWTKHGALIGSNPKLCQGVPHGLQAVREDNFTYLYHANNGQALHKTTANGTLVWSTLGPPPGHDTATPFKPTWFATPPESPFRWLADGYGSSKIFIYSAKDGHYMNYSFGGTGTEHGKFHTSHSIVWDDQRRQMVVCDRENHRLEYFDVDIHDPSVFSYASTTSLEPFVTRPCNIRFGTITGEEGKQQHLSIVPGLEGTIAILNRHTNEVLSAINISAVLGTEGFLHPHDAHFVPNTRGDFVVATWNPGRIGYFRRIGFNGFTDFSLGDKR